MSVPERPEAEESAPLQGVLDVLRNRVRQMENLAAFVDTLQVEVHRQRELGEALQKGFELVQQVVEEREAFFTLSLDMLCIATTEGYFHKVNHAFERTLGYRSDELLAQPFFAFIHPDDVERTRAEVAKLRSGIDTVSFENRYRHKDGSYRWLKWTTPAPLPGSRYLYAVARDVSADKLREEEVLHRASHDALTGLANRARFVTALSEAMTRVERGGYSLALIWLDLDGFKPINDAYGHQAGDLVLMTIAGRLNAIRRATDLLCRYGGDEFALIADGVDAEQAQAIAARMCEEIRRPIAIIGGHVQVDASVGVALAPWDAIDAGALLHRADEIMYQVKAKRHAAPT